MRKKFICRRRHHFKGKYFTFSSHTRIFHSRSSLSLNFHERKFETRARVSERKYGKLRAYKNYFHTEISLSRCQFLLKEEHRSVVYSWINEKEHKDRYHHRKFTHRVSCFSSFFSFYLSWKTNLTWVNEKLFVSDRHKKII